MNLNDNKKFFSYREKIDRALEQFFDDLPGFWAIDLSDHSRQAIDHLRDYTLRPGKRVRGSLAAAAYDNFTKQEFGLVGLQLGVVQELMQSYLLIVDDVMDKSALRRGQPTLHKLYEAEAQDFGGEHEANMMAVNVGLLAQHLASVAFVQLEADAKLVRQGFEILHTNIAATGFGQLDDLYQQLGRPVSDEDIRRKYYLKNSYYTFVNPLQLGAVLAGAGTPEVLQACKSYGLPAGMAFQLHDDYLGIFADAEQLGKPNLDDIREGKFTLLAQQALERARQDQVKELGGILGNPSADESDLKLMQEILEATGTKDYNQEQARQYAEEAKKSLKDQPVGDQAFQELLRSLVDYSIERQR